MSAGPAPELAVEPAAVERVAATWEVQQHDLAAASAQVAAAPTAGFTPAVAGAAARFLVAWRAHTAALGEAAGEQATDLHAALAGQVASDESAAARAVGLAVAAAWPWGRP